MSGKALFAIGVCVVALIFFFLLAAFLHFDEDHDWHQFTNDEWKNGDG